MPGIFSKDASRLPLASPSELRGDVTDFVTEDSAKRESAFGDSCCEGQALF